MTVSGQQLITTLSNNELQVPTEPDILEQGPVLSLESIPRVPVCCLTAMDVGGFGRSAQAAWLLDQVLKAFDISSWDARLEQLHGLDGDLQAFLAMLIHPGYGGKGAVCETIAIAIRSVAVLFVFSPLHLHEALF